MKLLRVIINLIAIVLVVAMGAGTAHAQPGHSHSSNIEHHEIGDIEIVDAHGSAPESSFHCGSPVLGVFEAQCHRPLFARVGFDLFDVDRPPGRALLLDPRPPRA